MRQTEYRFAPQPGAKRHSARWLIEGRGGSAKPKRLSIAAAPGIWPEPGIEWIENVLPEDLNYYERRAEAQLELAQRTSEPAAVAAHTAIAERYLEMCEPLRLADATVEPRLKPLFA